MKKINIEFAASSTGSWSPWHLDAFDKVNLNVIGTSDIGYFVKINENIFKITDAITAHKLQDVITHIQKQNDEGKISDRDASFEVLQILSTQNPNLRLQTPINDCIIQFQKKKKDEK